MTKIQKCATLEDHYKVFSKVSSSVFSSFCRNRKNSRIGESIFQIFWGSFRWKVTYNTVCKISLPMNFVSNNWRCYIIILQLKFLPHITWSDFVLSKIYIIPDIRIVWVAELKIAWREAYTLNYFILDRSLACSKNLVIFYNIIKWHL